MATMAPTRSSFMATWDRVSGATGYRLDVSTSSSFSSYVSGYQDLNLGNVTGRIIGGLSSGTTYYYRVRAYNALGTGGDSNAMTATTTTTTSGLVINPTFDSSILNNPNSAAIQSAINQAIAIYQSLFGDPITVFILFRYSNTKPDGRPFPSGVLSLSDFVIYPIQSQGLKQFEDTPERWLDVRWDIEEDSQQRFPARIKIQSVNEPGSLAQVTQVIADHDGNIDNIRMTRRAPDFTELEIDLEVYDLKHLNAIISQLKAKKVVAQVERVSE